MTVVAVDDWDKAALMRTFEALLGLPVGLLRPVPGAANRSLTLAETEMLRNLNKEFRANELSEELYSQLVRNGAVMHMKNTCAPGSGDVKIGTPRWAVEAAAGIGAEMAERIGGAGVRVLGDMRLLSELQKPATHVEGAPRIAPEAAAQALYGALAAAAPRPFGTSRPPSRVRFTRRRPRNWCGYSAAVASRGCGFGEPVPLLTAITVNPGGCSPQWPCVQGE